MSNTNYTELKTAVLNEILLDASTTEISQKMGYKFDQCKRWIENSKSLKWIEFCELCELLDLNLSQALNAFSFHFDDVTDSKDFFSYLKIQNSFETNQQIADYLHFHVSVIKRYCLGQRIPDVETIFKMIDYQKNLLGAFLQCLFNKKFKTAGLKKWIAENGDNIKTTSPGVSFKRVIPVNRESLKKINLILLKANSEILKIQQANLDANDEMFCLLLQLFSVTK